MSKEKPFVVFFNANGGQPYVELWSQGESHRQVPIRDANGAVRSDRLTRGTRQEFKEGEEQGGREEVVEE